MPRRKKADGAPAAATPPPNVGALTADEKLALHLQHQRHIAAAQAELRSANSDLRNARKKCKADLGDEGLKEVDEAIRQSTPEGEAEAEAVVQRILRVAQWNGADFGAQLELLATIPKKNWYEEGKRAGLAGLVGKAPEGLSQQDSQAWLEGWHAGQGVLLNGFGRKTDVVEGSASKPADAGGEEDLRGAEQRRREEEQATGKPSTIGIGTEPSTATVKQ